MGIIHIMMKPFGMPPLYPDCTGVTPMYNYSSGSDLKSTLPKPLPRIICSDGSAVSVQASEYHYCTPRNNEGPYTHVEAGYPQGKVPVSWKKYAEDKEDLNATVYPYMPIYLVEKYINLHGGLVQGALPARHPSTLGVKSVAQLDQRIKI